MGKLQIQTFYYFKPLAQDSLEKTKELFCFWAEELNVRGLVILGVEGINTTLSGPEEGLKSFVGKVQQHLGLPSLHIKFSESDLQIFKRFNVKIRDEIVTLKRADLVPETTVNNHLSPEDWQKAMEDPETIVLDTRNDYEMDIGKFKDAMNLHMDEFQEFPEKIKSLDKEKTYLIYCTGGIRCEKAILEMNEQGFKNVYQLDGGILNYLEKLPNKDFEGECFVFDSRVSVDQDLQPSAKYSLCPHCGDVAGKVIQCVKCDSRAKVCVPCLDLGRPELRTCSKNCAHHYLRDPDQKSPQQERFYHEESRSKA